MATLLETLKANVGGLWQQAQTHPFVDALADDSLKRERFIHYLEQDYVYLVGYSRAIAFATAKVPDLGRMTEFAALLHETLATEMQLHRDFCAEFGITPEDLAHVEASPTCRSYSDFCIATAATGDVLDLLCALIPCGVGYAEIGARLMQHPAVTPSHPYRQWIYTYGSAEYQEYARWMVATLNELGAGADAQRVKRLTELFRLGCHYEWQFWEMAWTGDKWPV